MAGRTSLSPILLTCARAVFQHKTGSIPVSLPNHQAHLKTPQVSTPTTAAGSSKSTHVRTQPLSYPGCAPEGT
ncbi:hypothetical protein KC347_g30 [Hortaea werneckii]|nr:hypothetical protein KC347_g30 [Hortaea werneckii]